MASEIQLISTEKLQAPTFFLPSPFIFYLYPSPSHFLPGPSWSPFMCSCRVFRELVKNGLSEGFGVDPMDRLSTSGPESSPSPHDNSSSSWNSSSSCV